MIHTTKMVEVNVNYDCEYLQDERFYCEFDGCKRSYKDKKFFSEHFKSDQTEDFKCKKKMWKEICT